MNANWEDKDYTLPILPEGFMWKLAFTSDDVSTEEGGELPWDDPSGITLGARTTAVLIGTA